MWFSRARITGLAFLAALSGCTKAADTGAPSSPLADRGRSVYMNNCVACHNANPKIDGPIGPAVAGSSRELLALRVLELKYPDGYKPKRNTHVMAPLPQLKGDIDALEAFLAH
jgi:mono/diheme cytochrome c family protein